MVEKVEVWNLGKDVRALLVQQIESVVLQAGYVRYTRGSMGYPASLQNLADPAVLEKYEALTARFSRLQDWLVHPFRSIAILEYEETKTERIPDLLGLMEKHHILADASIWREMRNAIAHEYRQEKKSLQALFGAVHDHSGTLLEITEHLERYAQALVNAGS